MENNKIIKTPRGTFKIDKIFTSKNEAKQNGFGYYFTNDNGQDIYTKTNYETWHTLFAIIEH